MWWHGMPLVNKSTSCSNMFPSVKCAFKKHYFDFQTENMKKATNAKTCLKKY